MSQPEFEAFLSRLGRSLRLTAEQRADVADELRDHLEERLSELTSRGLPREQALRQALDECGDAAELAANYSCISWERRRRWIMRLTTGSIAGLVAIVLLALSLWPDSPELPFARRAVAQSKDKLAAKSPATQKEENNAKTEALLASRRVKAEFQDVTLQDVLEFVCDVPRKDADKPKLQFQVERKALDDLGINPKEVQVNFRLADVRLDMLLDVVLRQLGLGYYIDDGIIFITSKEDLESRLQVRVYNCRDLLKLPRLPGDPGPAVRAVAGPAATPGGTPTTPVPSGTPPGGVPLAPSADLAGGYLGGGGPMTPTHSAVSAELIAILKTSVYPDTWNEAGGPGSIGEYRGLLVVSQTANVHRQIDQVLEMLREAAEKDAAGAAKAK